MKNEQQPAFNVNPGSKLEAVIFALRSEMATLRASGLGGDTALIQTIGNIKVRMELNGRSTIQFGKKSAPREAILTNPQ